MQLALLLYLASIADNLRSGMAIFIWLFGIATLACGLLGGIFAVNMLEQSNRTDKWEYYRRGSALARKVAMISFFAWVSLTVVTDLVPSKRDVYVMAGGYVALKAVNNESVQAAGSAALNAIEHWLDKELTHDAALATKQGAR